MKRQYISLILAVSNMAFVLLFLLLSFSNRPALDDFHFMANVNEHGVFEGTMAEYNGWSTRWTSVLLNHSILFLYGYSHYALFLFGIISLIAFTAVVYYFSENLRKLLQIGSRSSFLQLNISVFIVNILFLLTPAQGETWFWLCAACTYLWSVIMLFLSAAWIINPGKKLLPALAGCFAFVYVGGSNEPLALLVLTTLILLVLFFALKKKTFALTRKTLLLRLSAAFVFCLSSFIILRMGTGNATRESFFGEIGILQALGLNFKMSGILLLKILPPVLAGAIIFCLPAFYAGQLATEKGNLQNTNIKKIITYIIISYIIILYLYQLPVTYKTQDVIATRAVFPLVIATIIFTGAIFFLAGIKSFMSIKLKKALIVVPLMVAFLMNLYHLAVQFPATRTYARAYDERIELLKNQRNNETVIVLTKLPYSGLLCSAEISEDTSHYQNKHLKAGLGLNCFPRLEKQGSGNDE